MKTYTTLSGALRAAKGRAVLRIIDDPEELYVVGLSADTKLIKINGETGERMATVSYGTLAADFSGL